MAKRRDLDVKGRNALVSKSLYFLVVLDVNHGNKSPRCQWCFLDGMVRSPILCELSNVLKWWTGGEEGETSGDPFERCGKSPCWDAQTWKVNLLKKHHQSWENLRTEKCMFHLLLFDSPPKKHQCVFIHCFFVSHHFGR